MPGHRSIDCISDGARPGQTIRPRRSGHRKSLSRYCRDCPPRSKTGWLLTNGAETVGVIKRGTVVRLAINVNSQRVSCPVEDATCVHVFVGVAAAESIILLWLLPNMPSADTSNRSPAFGSTVYQRPESSLSRSTPMSFHLDTIEQTPADRYRDIQASMVKEPSKLKAAFGSFGTRT